MARTPTACTAIYLGSWFFAIASTLLTAFLLPSLLHQLPFLADTASLYVPCWYVYDASNTHFDNTAYTYATDYAIAVFMGYGAVTTSRCSRSKLRDRTVGLLTCMCVSVTMGGFCHQFFVGGYEALNEVTFRLLWSVCVGTVTMAGAYIGSIGSQLSLLSREKFREKKRFHVYVVPEWFWVLWGVFLTLLVAGGALSMKRPAADIFIAGITQTAPSLYIFVVTLSNKWHPSVKHAERSLWVAFFLNAPLLPLYPVLVKQGYELGIVNAILHSVLTLAWGLQFLSLNKFCRQLGEDGWGEERAAGREKEKSK